MRNAPSKWLLCLGSVLALAACDEQDPLVEEVTLEDDRTKLVSDPGAYEWWNFFAVDPAADIAVSMIFNSADPFNCDYRRALYANRDAPDANPPPSPSRYPLLQLQVTLGGKEVFSSLRNAPQATVDISAEAVSGRIGDSTFEGAMVDGIKTFTLHIDAPDTTNDSRLEADIVLRAGAAGFTIAGDGMYRAIEGGSQHAWQFPLGNPSSSGHVKVTRRDGAVLVDEDLEGGGYTDHMWGKGLLSDILESWHFGTVDLDVDGTLIYVWLLPRSGYGEGSGYVFLETPGELARAFAIESAELTEPLTGKYMLDYHRVLALSLEGGGTLVAALDPDALAADWPFQVAGPSLLSVSLPGVLERSGAKATSEYLWQPGIDSEMYRGMFDIVQNMEWGVDW